ncbi:MAG: site-specific integrase, partial [Mucilaginibacter polytrichastri]|nr:site-specific integrase [Mucilaginibacter polytrichastri]
MGTANSFGVIFIIRLDKLRSGKAPVYARVTVNTERVQITLKEQVDPRSWDQRKGLGKGNKAEIKSLNNFLSEIRTELGECYRELQLSKKPFTAEDVKNRFLRKEEVEKRFTDLFAYHNEKEKHKLDDNTLSHYKTTQRYLMEFVHSRHRKKDFQLSDLNLMFLTEFENFLRDYKPKGNKKPIGNSGAMTHMIRLKKMINLAISVDWMVKSPFRNFKIRIRHEERQHLTRSEMLRLEKKQFDMPRLDFVRDLFAFCCYTGLSYIDAINLKPSNLVEGIDGYT